MKKEQEMEREQEAGIGDFGGALIVRDPSLKLDEQLELPEFIQWLREDGFRQAFHKGWFDGVDWVYINIKAKKISTRNAWNKSMPDYLRTRDYNR